MSKRVVPGRMYVQKLKTGDYLYYIPYKQKKALSTGLIDSPTNRKVVEKLLERAYLKYLQNSELIENFERQTYFVFDVWSIYEQENLLSKEKNTIASYQLSFRNLITRNIEINSLIQHKNKRVSELELHIVSNIERMEQKLTNTTINIRIRSIQVFLNWLIDNDYLEKRISLKKYKKIEQQKKVVAYDESTIEVILQEFYEQDKEFALYLLLMGYTGLRMTETLNLLWEQVNFEEKTIALQNKIKKHEYDYIPISNKVNEILLELEKIREKRLQGKERLFRWLGSSYSRLGKKLSLALEKHGMKQKGTIFHGFRKMFLNYVSDIENINLLQFQKITRIRDTRTAHNHYLKKENKQMLKLLNK